MMKLGRGLILGALLALLTSSSPAQAKFFDLKGAAKVPPGAVVTPIGRQARVSTTLAEPDGSILVGGVTGTVLDSDGFITDPSWALVHYRPNGRVDRRFGKVVTNFGTPASLGALALQPDGKIVAVGSVRGAAGSEVALARYLPDGKLDSSFGQAGLVRAGLGSSVGAGSVAIQGDGRIVVGGTSVVSSASGKQQLLMVARFNPDGSPDASFGTQGAVATAFANPAYATDVTLLPGGGIEAAGAEIEVSNHGAENIIAARYTGSGSPDTSFGDQGKVSVPFLTPSAQIAFTFYGPIGFAPDHKIVATGVPVGQPRRQLIGAAVERLGLDGRPDPTFGSNGFSLFRERGTDKQKARIINAMALQGSGAVVLVGWPSVGPSLGLSLDRTVPTGGLDRRFTKHRPNGIYLKRFDMIPESASIDPRGRIVVASSAGTRRHRRYEFTVSRFKRSGALDRSFGRK
jgi:uncharacterized delta-60 repeat protein